MDGGEGGEYTLKIHYCRGESGKSAYLLLVNGVETKKLYFEATGRFSTKAMKEYSVKINLNKNQNTLILRKTGRPDKGIFVDAFAVEP